MARLALPSFLVLVLLLAPGARADEDLKAMARDPSLRSKLEAGVRFAWKGPAHSPALVLRIENHVLVLERGLRDIDPTVTLRRDGALLLVEGPATIRRETDHDGGRTLDATTLLGLPWGAPPPAAPFDPSLESRLQMVEGDASIAHPTSAAVNVARGEQAPLVEKNAADLHEFAEGKVELGGSKLTLLEHTSLRVVSIGPKSSVVEVLGVRLEMTRGTVIEAAFGSVELNLLTGTAIVSAGEGEGSLPKIVITNLDPGTGILTTTTVQLVRGQELGVNAQGAYTTPNSSSPVAITVALSAPVFDAQGNPIGRAEISSFSGAAPVGNAPAMPVLLDAIARVVAGANPAQLQSIMTAVQNGVSVTDLGLVALANTADPALQTQLQGLLAQVGSNDTSTQQQQASSNQGSGQSESQTSETSGSPDSPVPGTNPSEKSGTNNSRALGSNNPPSSTGSNQPVSSGLRQ